MTTKIPLRAVGAFLIVLGVVASAWVYNSTINEALEHKETIILIPRMSFLCVITATLGLMIVIFGDKTKGYLQGIRDRKRTMRDWLILAALATPAIIFHSYMEHQLTLLGYN